MRAKIPSFTLFAFNISTDEWLKKFYFSRQSSDQFLKFLLTLCHTYALSNIGMIPCFFSSSYKNFLPACVHSVCIR